MRRFKVTVLSRNGCVKYQYHRVPFENMHSCILYYEQNVGRVIKCEELNVRRSPVKGKQE